MALTVPGAVCFLISFSHCRAIGVGDTIRVVLASKGYMGKSMYSTLDNRVYSRHNTQCRLDTVMYVHYSRQYTQYKDIVTHSQVNMLRNTPIDISTVHYVCIIRTCKQPF